MISAVLARKRVGLKVSLLSLIFLFGGCESLPELNQVLNVPTAEDVVSTGTIAAGLREALEMGSRQSVRVLGRPDGFLDSRFHIPLPDSLQQGRDIAGRFGLAGMFDEMEVQLNRAAEAAVPKAQKLFVDAIRQLTFDDVMKIYNGPDDAATRYLRRTTSAELSRQMRPIVDASLAEVGALNTFSSLAEQYNRLPLVPPIDADLSSHVLRYAEDALFTLVAQEEAAIRRNPAKRTTELLREVFG